MYPSAPFPPPDSGPDSAPAFDPLEERIVRRIPWEVAAAAGVLAVPAALLFDFRTAAFFLAGGLLSALSFLWLKSVLGRVLGRGRTGAVKAGLALYGARFLLISALFFLIILLYPKKLIAFAAGFSTVIPVFLGETAAALARWKPRKPWNS